MELWQQDLESDEDKEFLLDGITNGFQLILSDSTLTSTKMENYRSVTNSKAKVKVEQTIQEEIREGNYIISPTRPTIVSALAAVPKQDSDELRLIHDCSMPKGKGLNSYVPVIDKMSFQTIDDAIKLIGPGYYLGKTDLQHAYHSVPIHPSNYAVTALRWVFEGDVLPTYLMDT